LLLLLLYKSLSYCACIELILVSFTL
jgi:hypothetical protein